jgi:hypothetical protein
MPRPYEKKYQVTTIIPVFMRRTFFPLKQRYVRWRTDHTWVTGKTACQFAKAANSFGVEAIRLAPSHGRGHFHS